VPSLRLPAVAALGAVALVLTGCVGEEQTAVGVDELHVAVLGTITPAQQAFFDRMDELSEGSIVVDVQENWTPDGGADVSPEVALAQAVEAGDVDIAWVPVRALTALGVKGIDALQAPFLIQTHDQQRSVALGVPGELIRNALRNTGVTGLAMLPGPLQYPVASGAPMIDLTEWAGKTVAVGTQGASNAAETATIEAFGATAQVAGTSPVADVASGSVSAATADLDALVANTTATGPYMTADIPLWPEMSMIIANDDLLNRLSSRQHGFLDGSVVRAQDGAMATPDEATGVAAACAIGTVFSNASPDQVAAYKTAVKPVYAALQKSAAEARLLAAIEEEVKQNAGTGFIPGVGACFWTAPAAP
jgi:TRAP-type C4-dicarboxylate transport system substrate-binding protein